MLLHYIINIYIYQKAEKKIRQKIYIFSHIGTTKYIQYVIITIAIDRISIHMHVCGIHMIWCAYRIYRTSRWWFHRSSWLATSPLFFQSVCSSNPCVLSLALPFPFSNAILHELLEKWNHHNDLSMATQGCNLLCIYTICIYIYVYNIYIYIYIHNIIYIYIYLI